MGAGIAWTVLCCTLTASVFGTSPQDLSRYNITNANSSSTDREGSEDSNANKTSVNLAAVIGGVVGGVIVLLGFVVALVCWRKRRQARMLKKTDGLQSQCEMPPLLEDEENRKSNLDGEMSNGEKVTVVRPGARHAVGRKIEMEDNQFYEAYGPENTDTINNMCASTTSGNASNKETEVAEENIEDLYAKPIKKRDSNK